MYHTYSIVLVSRKIRLKILIKSISITGSVFVKTHSYHTVFQPFNSSYIETASITPDNTSQLASTILLMTKKNMAMLCLYLELA